MQTRLTRLETAPKRAALDNGAVGYDQLETNVRTQLDAALAEAQNAAIQASKGILSYRMSEDPTTTRTISSYSLEFKTATIFTSTDNYYQIGSSIIISGLNPALDGEHLVTASFYSTDLKKFQIIVDSTATIPSTPASPGAEVVLVPKEGDEWVDPTAGNETKSWNEVDDKWVKKDPVVEDGAIGVTKDYNTTIRPNRITETISNARVDEGIVTVTATSHPFQEGDRLDIVLTVSGNALSKSPAIVFEVPDSNTFTYKIDDLTISVPTATAPTGAATAKYYLIDGDRWTDRDGVVWVWNSSTSSFEKKQDVNSTQKTQTYYSNNDPTTSVSLASFVSSDGTVTITTTSQHYFIPGSVVEITSTSDPELNGQHVVSTVAGTISATGNGTSFTFQMDIEDVSLSSFSGTTAVLRPRIGDKWVDTNDGNKQYVWANSADGDGELWQSEAVTVPKEDELATMTIQRSVDPNNVQLFINRRSLVKGIVTVRTTQPHGLKRGDRITVDGFANNVLNVTPGPGYVLGVLNSTEFTYKVPSGTRKLDQQNVTATVTVRYFLAVGDTWIDTSNNRVEYKWTDTDNDGVGDTWEDAKTINPKNNEFAQITYRTSVNPKTITRTINERGLSKGVVTVTTATAHGFTVGDRLTITGFANTILNGSPVFVKQVLSNTRFTYEVPSGSRTIAFGGGSATASYFFVENDLWVDPVKNQTYYYDPTLDDFVLRQDTDVATALINSENAAIAANGKNKIFYQENQPTGGTYIVGDIWFDTNDGNRQYVYTGTDAVTWITQSSNFGSTTIRSVAFGNSTWVLAGDTGQIRTSTDTILWTTQVSNFGSSSILTTAFGNGTFVAGGVGGTIRTSTNGVLWTTRVSNFGSSGVRSVAFGGGSWVAAGYGGVIRRSTDNGATWATQVSNFGATVINSVAFGSNLWVAVGAAGQIRTSADAITWVSQVSNFDVTAIQSVAFGNNLWTIAGDAGQIRTSTNAVTWVTQISNFGSSTITSIRHSNNVWIAAGASGQIRTSTDAVTWVTQDSKFASTTIQSLANSNNTWVAVGDAGQIRTSPEWAPAQDGAIATAQALANSALTTANGKNKVTYSTSAPGTTANTAGDLWFQFDTNQIIIGQFEGLGGTSWRSVTIGDTVIANLTAGKITSGIINAALVQISTNGATSGTSARVQLTSSGLTAFDASGSQTVNINAATGAATFRGEIITGSQITGGSINIAGNFIVTSAGALTASSASITGAVTATSGRIGNFQIVNNDYILYGASVGFPDLLLAGGSSVSTFAISSLTKGASFTQLQATGGAANAVSVTGGVTATGDSSFNRSMTIGLGLSAGTTALLVNRNVSFTNSVIDTASAYFDGPVGIRFPGTESASVTWRVNSATVNGQSVFMLRRQPDSSIRYKENLVDIDDIPELNSDLLLNLKVRAYSYKDGHLSDTDSRLGAMIPGFIAEEVDQVYPIAVDYDEEGLPKVYGDMYLMPGLIRLVQKLYKRVEDLENVIKSLQ